MNLFVRKHENKINATLGCFDRMLFRGYLPIQSGWAMAQFLKQKDIRSANLKDFLSDNAGRINDYAKTLAAKLGIRPWGTSIQSAFPGRHPTVQGNDGGPASYPRAIQCRHTRLP
jgi:hypothetical protein